MIDKLEDVVYKRDIDTDTRKKLAGEGSALPDGSYPIESTGDLHNAAVLARSGHGNVSAAKALIGRRARALGVPNPLTKADEFSSDGELWKSDEHHLVYGTVLAPERRDSQGDIIVKEDAIRTAAHRYMEESRESDVQHAVEKADGVVLVESAMAPHDMVIGGKPVTKGSWFAAYKVTDPEVWGKVKKGELTGFSIRGHGIRLADEAVLKAAVELGKAEAVEDAIEKAQLTDIVVGRVSLVDSAAVRDASDPTAPQTFLLYKNDSSTPEGGTMPDAPTDLEKAQADLAAAQEALEKANANSAEEKAAREKAEKERDDRPMAKKDDPAPLDKSELPEAARIALEKAEADAAAMSERLEKSEKAATEANELAKAERDQRVTREWIAKAETGELRGIQGAPGEVGPLMKRLAEAAPTDWAEFEKSTLIPMVTQVNQSNLLKEAGVGGEGPPIGSALAKYNEKVQELLKSDHELTPAKAKERVLKSEPQLQAQIAEEMGTGQHVAP